MNRKIETRQFNQIKLDDPFFDTLKEDYPAFEQWFLKKANESAMVLYDEIGRLEAFLYMKVELGPVNDVKPVLKQGKWLKVGTMKVNPHGTRLGERFIKKILDYAIVQDINNIYVTVFAKHTKLVDMFMKYGFTNSAVKESEAGQELVLIKALDKAKGDILLDYPLVQSRGKGKHLLAIKPEYHSRLFPDSILNNESIDIIKDVSHTNSIHKIYIAAMEGLGAVKPGDLLLIYRMKTPGKKAWYTSVATSLCVVEEVRNRNEFSNFQEFIQYCKDYSIFTERELEYYWTRNRKLQVYVFKMTYNIALRRRLNQQRLVEEVGLDKDKYWGYFQLSEQEYEKIIIKGDVYESLIID